MLDFFKYINILIIEHKMLEIVFDYIKIMVYFIPNKRSGKYAIK